MLRGYCKSVLLNVCELLSSCVSLIMISKGECLFDDPKLVRDSLQVEADSLLGQDKEHTEGLQVQFPELFQQ